MFKTRLDTFENTFGHFWNFEKKIFLKIFENSTLHGTLGINFFRKNHHKTRLDTFGNTFDLFRNFENIFFRKFSETRYSMENWSKIFRKVCPKTRSKHVWILLVLLLGIFGNLNFFFENFRKLDPPRNTGQKKNSKNLTQNKFKARLDAFGNDFGHFWNFAIFLIFLKIFEDSTFHGKLGKNFSKSLPQNTFKTRLDTFGNDFGHFRKFETFLIFLKIFEDSTFHGKLGKNFSKSLPQNTFKTRLDTFGNTFGHFWNFEIIIFLKIFEYSTFHGRLGINFFSKKSP